MALDKLNSRKYRNHKERVFARDGRQCRYCGNDENLQVDHIISRKNGGTHDMDNLQVLCRDCNLRKSSKEKHRDAPNTIATERTIREAVRSEHLMCSSSLSVLVMSNPFL